MSIELHAIAAEFARELEFHRRPHESWELRNWPRGTEAEPERMLLFTVRVRNGFGSGSWTVELAVRPTDVQDRIGARARVAEAYDKLRHAGRAHNGLEP